MPEKLAKAVLIGLGLILGAGILFLAGRYLLPWTAPLLTAWVLATLLEPAVGFLTRHRWKRGAAAGLCTLTALGLLLWGLTALLFRGLGALSELTKALPGAMEALSTRLEALEKLAETHIRAAPEPAGQLLESALSGLLGSAASLPGELSRGLVALLSRTAQASPDTLLFFVTAALGTYFISAAFPTVNAFLLAQLPEGLRRRFEGLGADLKEGFGGLLRAQLILMAICFFELLAAFLLLGVRPAVILAAVTALIDALPVFGTGVVLALGALLPAARSDPPGLRAARDLGADGACAKRGASEAPGRSDRIKPAGLTPERVRRLACRRRRRDAAHAAGHDGAHPPQ